MKNYILEGKVKHPDASSYEKKILKPVEKRMPPCTLGEKSQTKQNCCRTRFGQGRKSIKLLPNLDRTGYFKF